MQYKKLAFAVCLHGRASISLQDTGISPPHTRSFHVTGGLFSKWSQAYLSKIQYG